MKKIERYPVIINVPIIPKTTVGYIETRETESPYYCKVLKSDLDQLEREREEAENLIFEYCHEWYDFCPAEGNSYVYKKFIAYLEKTSGKTYQELKEMKG